MTASTLIELDTAPPAITFADDLVNGALPFTLDEPALTTAELLTADGTITLTILNGTIQIPAGHNDAAIRVHLRDAVANEAIVEHEIITLAQLFSAFADHAATTGTLQPSHPATQAVPSDKARTAATATHHATTTARQTDSKRP